MVHLKFVTSAPATMQCRLKSLRCDHLHVNVPCSSTRSSGPGGITDLPKLGVAAVTNNRHEIKSVHSSRPSAASFGLTQSSQLIKISCSTFDSTILPSSGLDSQRLSGLAAELVVGVWTQQRHLYRTLLSWAAYSFEAKSPARLRHCWLPA